MQDRLRYVLCWNKQCDEIAAFINENGIDLLGLSELNHWQSISNIAQNISETRLESDLEKFCEATVKEFARRSKRENEQTRDTPNGLSRV